MNQPPDAASILTLSAVAGQRLAARALTIATAESCTAGLLASTLTDVAGSSAYVMGGVVSYSNQAKMELLGVQESTLLAHGAVSAETAAEMAPGVRRLLKTDLGVSVTGIAGPGGGTPGKPVGTVYIHLSAADAEWGEHHVWPHDRGGNKLATVAAVLRLLLRYLDQAAVSEPSAALDPRLQILNRPVIVEASWKADKWRPQAFWLDGRRRQITGWGRQTAREDGVTVVLVEDEEGAFIELLADVAAGQWRVGRMWRAQRAV